MPLPSARRSTIRRGGTFDFQADGSLSTQGYGGTAFNNSGTLEKTAGSGTTTVSFPLDNTGGTVAITSPGTLNFSGGGTFSGTMTVSGTVNISSGTFTAAAGSTISSPSGGTGDLEFSGNGTLSLGGSLSTNIVTIAGGTLTGSGIIASGTQTTWTSGEVAGSLSNAGALTVSGSVVLLAGTLTNTGTIDVAARTRFMPLPPARRSTIRRGAPSTSRPRILSTQGYGGIAFNDSGTLEKTAGSAITTISFPLSNSGTIESDSAILDLTGGGSGTNATVNADGTGIVALTGSYSGSFAGSGLGAVQLSYFTATGANGVTLDFSGSLLQWTGGTLTGTVANAGTLTVSGAC